LKQENRRLLKIAEAAGRLNVAVEAYLKTNSGKSLSNLKAKRERLARLLAAQSEETQPDLFDAC